MITTSYPLTHDSVSGVFVKNLVENFSENVFCTVVTPDNNNIEEMNSLTEIIRFRYAPKAWQVLAHLPGGIPVSLVKSKLNFLLLPLFLLSLQLSCISIARRKDLLHANWAVAGLLAGIAGILIKKPVITTLRGEDVAHLKTSRWHYFLLLFSLKLNQHIVCVSSNMEILLKEHYPQYSHKICHIPNGVSDRFLENNRSKQSTPTLLTVGSLIPRKDIKTLIIALSQIPNEKRPKLSIIGNGLDEFSLKQQCDQRNITNWVEFIGDVSHSTIEKYYASHDIFILSSISEGRPNVVMEAMASGMAIICSNIQGANEIITNQSNGLIFSTGDPLDLTKKINLLLDNPALRLSLGRNAKKYVIDKKLSWTETSKKYINLYRKVLQK